MRRGLDIIEKLSESLQMKIVGIEDMSPDRLKYELEHGGKFVVFEYTISIIVMTFKRPSNVYFVSSGYRPVFPAIGYSLSSFLLGWWGVSWGPVYTITSVIETTGGGRM